MNIYIFGSGKKSAFEKYMCSKLPVQPPIVTGLLQTVPHHHCPPPVHSIEVTNYYYYNINL
jgi:hypothetical protein